MSNDVFCGKQFIFLLIFTAGKVDEYSSTTSDYGRLFIRIYSDGTYWKFSVDEDGAVEFCKSKLCNPDIGQFIFINGFTANDDNARSIRKAILEKGDTCYWEVDVTRAFMAPNYIKASKNTKLVGTQVGDFVNYLVLRGFKAELFHLVGFSLGAHAVAYAAEKFKLLSNGSMVGHATFLDAAKPCFFGSKTLATMPYVAAKVDAYHCNAGVFGIERTVGQADFYVDYGKTYHDKCPSYYGATVKEGDRCLAIEMNSDSDLANGRNTGKTIVNGYNWDGTWGVYGFFTGLFPPYCLGATGTKQRTDPPKR